MDKEIVYSAVNQLFADCPGNIVAEDVAICPETAGVVLYEAPLVGIGAADDVLFEKYKEENVIGPWFMAPAEWLPGAKSVISLFFPFAEEVKASNRKAVEDPSPAWLHGRIEGQQYLVSYIKMLQEWFDEQGIRSCVPALDPRFRKVSAGDNMKEYACVDDRTFGSNWSERHAAYVCGLGTFGLSKGLITEKGMAGRFVSIIVDAEIVPDIRAYSGVYDYCTMCGACVRRCPAGAISPESGKDHNICNEWLQKIGKKYAPRYGCGLCQTKVPCEGCIPGKGRR